MAIKSKRGGKRPGAGRKKGVRDAATGEQRASIQELARSHDRAALATLVRVATSSASDGFAVSAAIALLDRGYGKPGQAMEISGPAGGPIEQISRIERVIVDNPPDRDS